MVKQMSCRLNGGAKDAFGAYARQLGLQNSELARLLIAREGHHRQLEAFIKGGGAVTSATPSAAGRPKVTAHFSSPTAAAEFDRYADDCGVSRDRAAAWILERELRERWLMNALLQPPN